MKNKAAQTLGRLGGLAKSPAKSEAAKRNGAKGGWPKGKKRKPLPLPVAMSKRL